MPFFTVVDTILRLLLLVILAKVISIILNIPAPFDLFISFIMGWNFGEWALKPSRNHYVGE